MDTHDRDTVTVKLEAWELKALVAALKRDRDAADIRRNRAKDRGDKGGYMQARDDAEDSQYLWLRFTKLTAR